MLCGSRNLISTLRRVYLLKTPSGICLKGLYNEERKEYETKIIMYRVTARATLEEFI